MINKNLEVHENDVGTVFEMTVIDAAKSISGGTLTTRTDANTGVISFTQEHRILELDVVIVSWGTESRSGMIVTAITATTITVDGGSGASLPSLDSGGISVDVVVNLADAETMEIHFLKPDGTTLSKDAEHMTDGTDGKMFCASADGDLTPNGKWKMEGYVAINDTHKWHTDRDDLTVYPNII